MSDPRPVPEVVPDAIRHATLKRRVRGYDRDETRRLLTTAAESYERVLTECVYLSDEATKLRRERDELLSRSSAERGRLDAQLSERDEQIAELDGQIARFEEERSKQAVELDRAREELSSARATQIELQVELRDLQERLARITVREKAMTEQIAMFASQLEQDEALDASSSANSRVLPEQVDRAASALLRLDRVVSALERESRREAELTLKKARARADEIIRSAEARHREPTLRGGEAAAEEPNADEYDPFGSLARIEPSVADAEQSGSRVDIGEARWTARETADDTPEPSR